jgi:hypothetical protein
VRTPDALLRFVRGLGGPLTATHALFEPVDPAQTEDSWRTWLYERRT